MSGCVPRDNLETLQNEHNAGAEEDVKKILARVYTAGLHRQPLDLHANDVAHQIYQLIEKDVLKSGDRWLTDEDICYTTTDDVGISVRALKNGCFANTSQADIDDNIDKIIKAQRDLIASICQARVEGIVREIGSYLGFDMVESEDLPGWWQELKKQEGIKEVNSAPV